MQLRLQQRKNLNLVLCQKQCPQASVYHCLSTILNSLLVALYSQFTIPCQLSYTIHFSSFTVTKSLTTNKIFQMAKEFSWELQTAQTKKMVFAFDSIPSVLKQPLKILNTQLTQSSTIQLVILLELQSTNLKD